MTFEEFDILCRPDVRQAVRDNLGRDHLAVALDRRVPHAALVAGQVKCLARARAKLPSYAAAECILPVRAFEQASSEAAAAHKPISGASVLDLTCGLGVDARALARRFDRVVALERDGVLAAVTARNLRMLGVGNVEVLAVAAEEYLRTTDERFDWVYADPDRRDAAGRKLVRLEECSPDVVALLPAIRRAGARLCLKNSPLFDVDEAFRLFPGCGVETVSLDGECKEVLVLDDGAGERLTATALGAGSVTYARSEAHGAPCGRAFDPSRYGWLFIPDVALQKGRMTLRAAADAGLDCWSNDGYAFSEGEPAAGLLGRAERIVRIEPFDPKALRKRWKGRAAELLRRDFPLAVAEICRRTGLREGGGLRLAFTRADGRLWTVVLAE